MKELNVITSGNNQYCAIVSAHITIKRSRLRKKNMRVVISTAREFAPKWNNDAREETTPVPMDKSEPCWGEIARMYYGYQSSQKSDDSPNAFLQALLAP